MRASTITLVGTYPPTQCGLATFTAALTRFLGGTPGGVRVLQVVDAPSSGVAPEVSAQLVNGSVGSLLRAREVLELSNAVILQHEYGIFGGPDGQEVLDLLLGLSVPVVSVLHTVLVDPSQNQRRVLQSLVEESAHLVTMTHTAKERLVEYYQVDPQQISVIPHGAADDRALGHQVRAELPAQRRPVILTWGLLGPGKGIEWALEALVSLKDLNPRYLVVGRTHPKVKEHHGDTYRRELIDQAARLGIADLVEFDDSYLASADLARVVAAADVVLLPYDSREQVTSGVLIEAVAAQRPVISTAFPHAVELLADGTGLLVAREDPVALSSALRRVLTHSAVSQDMTARARAKAPELLWDAVAERYWQLVERVCCEAPRPSVLASA